jgi:hypothetical protein
MGRCRACDGAFCWSRLPTVRVRARAVPHRDCVLGQSSSTPHHILAEGVFSSDLFDDEIIEAV